MHYNVVLEFQTVIYPRIYLIIPEVELLRLVEAYANGKESVFINGEKIFISDPYKFKIYDTSKVSPNNVNEIQRRIDEYLFMQTLDEINESHFSIFGVDVTSKYIKGAWGDRLPELFNLYIRAKSDPQIKYALHNKNIEDVLYAIKQGEKDVFVDGRTLELEGLETIKIFDVSKSLNKTDKGELKREMDIFSKTLHLTGLALMKTAGVEVTDKFDIKKPIKQKVKFESNEIFMENTEMKNKKIFISHASLDAPKIDPLIDLLHLIGLKEEQIFYSSNSTYGVDLGEDIFERLKMELDNNNIIAAFILSDNFYKSPICLCEMGAVWVKSNKHIPILIPPFDFNQVKGVFPNSLGLKINDKKQLNSLKEKIETHFELKQINFSRWEEKRDEYLSKINSID